MALLGRMSGHSSYLISIRITKLTATFYWVDRCPVNSDSIWSGMGIGDISAKNKQNTNQMELVSYFVKFYFPK